MGALRQSAPCRLLTWLPCFLASMAATHATGEAAAVELFVSPSGDDSSSGRAIAEPLRTLPRARQAARTALANGDSVVVSLLAGQYRLNSTLEFGAADSPDAPGQSCTWRAHPSNHAPATISGSREVPWSLFSVSDDPRIPPSARGKVLAGNILGAGISDFGQGVGWDFELGDRMEVFVGGETMTLARYPNKDERPAGSAFVGFAQMSGGVNNGAPPGKFNAISWADEDGAAGLTTARVQVK